MELDFQEDAKERDHMRCSTKDCTFETIGQAQVCPYDKQDKNKTGGGKLKMVLNQPNNNEALAALLI